MDKNCTFLNHLTNNSDINALFNNYIDGNLDNQSNNIITKHLQGCNYCRKEVEGLKETITLVKELKNLDIPDPSEEYYDTILNNIKPKDNIIKIPRFNWNKYAVAGFIIVTISAFLMIHNSNNTQHITENTNNTDQFFSYYESITDENTSILAEAGLPTDEWGLLDVGEI